jgi:DNA-binding MarR family transcriptional regulator
VAAARHRSVDLDDALAYRIHRTNRLLRTHLARFLNDVAPDITPEQWFVLARLHHSGPLRQVDLAEPVLGDPPNVSRLIDALVGRGYVERSPDPGDRRSWLVGPTGLGHEFVTRVLDRAVEEREAVFAGFSDAELDALAAMLDRIDQNVRTRLDQRRPAARSLPIRAAGMPLG